MPTLRSSLLASCLLAATLVGCGGPTKFDPVAMNDPAAVQSNADKYWKRDGWWGCMKGVNKVAIVQFNVEYVTENTSKSGADALSVLGVMEMAGMGKRKREFAEDFKAEFPTTLYNQFVDALKANGFDVVPTATITGHPAFAELKAAAAGQTQSQGRGNESAKVQTYPVKSLPLPDNGFLNLGAGDTYKRQFRIAGDSGAQAAVFVHIRMGLDDDGHAIIGGGSTIQAFYEPEKFKGMNNVDEWTFKQRGTVVGGPQLRDDVAVIDSKEFKAFQGDIYTVNTAKFQDSIMKMYPSYVRMGLTKLKG